MSSILAHPQVSHVYVSVFTADLLEIPTRSVASKIPAVQEKPVPKPKWHFGIRSRSPPMEVMLEIYKSLSGLGMEWKRKKGMQWPDIGPLPTEGYSEEVDALLDQHRANGQQIPEMGKPKPPKADVVTKEKAAQDLFIVETRHRYGDVMVGHPLVSGVCLLMNQVRMDLQLYRVDAENYLVDFKNIGYYHASPEELHIPEASTAGLSSSHTGSASAKKIESIGGVSGPFHFLEMACTLIAELAQ